MPLDKWAPAGWHWLLWALIASGVTLLLLLLRPSLDKSHFALTYLLLVLAGSAVGGHRIGFALAVASFLLFDWFFLPPYGTLGIANAADWLVLATFAIVSGVAAQLVHRLRREAASARERTIEVDRFAALGASTLNVANARDALSAITDVISQRLRLETCRIHPMLSTLRSGSSAPDSLIAWVIANGCTAIGIRDGTTRLTSASGLPDAGLDDACRVLLPLHVRDRVAGVLEIAANRLTIAPAETRFLNALIPYAALAVERVELEATAGHAEQLRESDRLKNALLASVSHDLRTPLTTIMAVAHDLGGKDPRAALIEEEAGRLNRMVGDLLDLSRVQSGTSLTAVELNAVDDLVGAALQRVAGATSGRDVRVTLEDGGTLLLGTFDLAASVRILVNLIENAAKHAPDGSIELDVARRGAWLELRVSDRGRGVDELDRDRIFAPFYRPSGTLPDVQGSGLGLAIARGLAESQGGALTYLPRPGGGSSFILKLAAADLA